MLLTSVLEKLHKKEIFLKILFFTKNYTFFDFYAGKKVGRKNSANRQNSQIQMLYSKKSYLIGAGA